jgi:hypothetical protein
MKAFRRFDHLPWAGCHRAELAAKRNEETIGRADFGKQKSAKKMQGRCGVMGGILTREVRRKKIGAFQTAGWVFRMVR